MQSQKNIFFCGGKKIFLVFFLFFIILGFLTYFLIIKVKQTKNYERGEDGEELVEEEVPFLEFIDLIGKIQDEGFISGTVKEISFKEDKKSREGLILEITLLINLEAYFKDPPVPFVEKKFLKRETHPYRDRSSFFVTDNINQDNLLSHDSVMFEMDLRKLKEGEYVEVVIDGDVREIMRKDYYFPPLIRWTASENSDKQSGSLKLVPHLEEMKERYDKQMLCGDVEGVVKQNGTLKEILLSIIMPYWFVDSPTIIHLKSFSVNQNTEFRQGNPKELFSLERFLSGYTEFWKEDPLNREYPYVSFDSEDLQAGDLLCILVEENIGEIMRRENYTLVKALKIVQ
jgi:hypothetical protein